MKTFRQFVAEGLTKKTWRGETSKGFKRLENVTFTDAEKVADTAVHVYYAKERSYPSRTYNVDFSLNHSYHRPNPNSSGMMWRNYEKARAHLPSIMRRVKKSIEGFAAEKKPNQIHMQANDESKLHLYKTFAHHLARKHGGHVEEVFDRGYGLPKYIVHLPGKKALKESKVLDAAKAAVKKNWKTKLALAATPLPGTIVAAGAMAVKDAVQAYRGSK